jgi:hypothetical protein
VTTLGKIQRQLSRVWIVRPDAVVTTTDLARAAVPRALGVVTHNHRHSVRRAHSMKSNAHLYLPVRRC